MTEKMKLTNHVAEFLFSRHVEQIHGLKAVWFCHR